MAAPRGQAQAELEVTEQEQGGSEAAACATGFVAGSLAHSVFDKTHRHLLFWDRCEVARPLAGFTVGAGPDAWSYWLTNPGAAALWQRKDIRPEHIDVGAFVEGQRAYLAGAQHIDDDVFRAAIPFASIPWMEAIIGCRVASTDAQFVAVSPLKDLGEYAPISFDAENPWVRKYVEFLDVYSGAFKEAYPVGQSVLRGASDLLAALLGAQGAVEALMAEPARTQEVLANLTEVLGQFIRFQQEHLPEYHKGYVLGQYELWSPGMPQRMQEDNLALYSPEIYRELLKPLNASLAEASEYTLFHLHSSSLFLLDDLLDIPGVKVFQISKDEGHRTWRDILPQLQRVQDRGRCLLIKGRLDAGDLAQIKRQLSPRGLCIEPVVDSVKEARDMLPALREW